MSELCQQEQIPIVVCQTRGDWEDYQSRYGRCKRVLTMKELEAITDLHRYSKIVAYGIFNCDQSSKIIKSKKFKELQKYFAQRKQQALPASPPVSAPPV